MNRTRFRPAVVQLLGVLLGWVGGAAVGWAQTEVAPHEPRRVEVRGESVYALGFDLLASFPYTIVDAGTGASDEEIEQAMAHDQVPDWLRIYDGQRVLLTGYMMPLTVDKGRTKKFVMMKDVTTCCYGATPSMNDYLIVTMPGDGAEIIADVPVELLGTFRIEHRYDGGYVVSLFVMDGEVLLGVKK